MFKSLTGHHRPSMVVLSHNPKLIFRYGLDASCPNADIVQALNKLHGWYRQQACICNQLLICCSDSFQVHLNQICKIYQHDRCLKELCNHNINNNQNQTTPSYQDAKTGMFSISTDYSKVKNIFKNRNHINQSLLLRILYLS